MSANTRALLAIDKNSGLRHFCNTFTPLIQSRTGHQHQPGGRKGWEQRRRRRRWEERGMEVADGRDLTRFCSVVFFHLCTTNVIEMLQY